ncbi:MAG: type II toxin-antitoxin system death-on-curing family toxin [Acidobacteria bacterium]|nr:type II toxin-antitoxin system death-on-curing family toxin [Acidobacteriota bacterium]
MIEPTFLALDEVLRIHEEQLDAFGGIHGIRDRSLLESAVMTPQASFGGEYLHNDLFEMAAAYAFHIAENQPFLDGNKRTALVSALTFLDLNGYVVLDPTGSLYSIMIDIANRTADKYDLAELLRSLPVE